MSLIKSREFLAQVAHPEELTEHLKCGVRVAYAGFDPTAESLHVGNLMPIMALRRWQQSGHKAVVLMGGATAMIGDPSGKTELRQVLSEDTIDQRIQTLKSQFSRFLATDSAHYQMVNNADWFRSMQYLPLLREIGADFTVNRMLAAECFKQRYEKGLSFLEFNYMILQSYDFLHLNRTHNVTVQIGGDDQWSNMIGGMDLIRRKERKQAFIVTNPLLTTSSGLKMGKTEKGAVWLNPDMTSPYDLFQYFRNVDDDMVEKCLYYFTDLPVNEVKRLGGLKDASINDAKIVLAFELTKLIHGEDDARRSRDQATSLFAGAGGGDAPQVTISRSTFGHEMPIIEILVATKICESKSDGRRLIEQGGITVGDVKISDAKFCLTADRFHDGSSVLIRKGKKNFYRLKLT
ncbi:MAG: tyrosine--tRNA ligase [Proteobacteria bacterium]|nr:tyrosine--tRNA ligase [Pseudomonadota bacterium]